MSDLLSRFYALLCALSALAMASTFVIVMLGILGRETGWFALPGLDAYAGYAIAAALFLALPETLKRGDHIRALHEEPDGGRIRIVGLQRQPDRLHRAVAVARRTVGHEGLVVVGP